MGKSAFVLTFVTKAMTEQLIQTPCTGSVKSLVRDTLAFLPSCTVLATDSNVLLIANSLRLDINSLYCFSAKENNKNRKEK